MMNFATSKVNFPPIFILNAEEFEGETTGSSGRSKITAGINSVFRLMGRLLYGGVDGMSEQQVKPSVIYGKTSEPEKHRDTIQAYELHIYDSAGMGWVKINESPYASARSRTEALTDYLILVTEIASVVENAGSWLLETLLNYGYNLTGS